MTESRQQAQAKKASHHARDRQSDSHFLDSSWRTAVMRLAFSLMHDREGMQTSVATTWCTFEQMMASSSGRDEDEQCGATTTNKDMMAGCTSVDGDDGRDKQGSATTSATADAEMASSPFGRRRLQLRGACLHRGAPCLDLSSDLSSLYSSHLYSSHLYSSEEAEQVEPWDVSELFASVRSRLSCRRSTVLTYDSHMNGHVALFPEGEKYPEEELVLGWQPEWGARQAVAVHVEVEGAPCSKAASVQERKSAAMLAAVLEIESYNLDRSAAVRMEPVSSLGAAALPQGSIKEGQTPAKCTGAGGKAETQRPVQALLRAAGALAARSRAASALSACASDIQGI
ncbi:hypothetical protein FOA52_003415 [Chlamydomonas sp. UWO 241]|nr:hypothetical protein FOA52_003415 [Chlamydomonas sp. UWO 241]